MGKGVQNPNQNKTTSLLSINKLLCESTVDVGKKEGGKEDKDPLSQKAKGQRGAFSSLLVLLCFYLSIWVMILCSPKMNLHRTMKNKGSGMCL